MAPPALNLSEDEVDDLLYFARTGEKDELTTLLSSLAEREKVSPAEILASAKDEGKSTCLHMATGNGHTEIVSLILSHLASRPKEESKAFLDAPNEFGNTGMHWAALGGHLEVVKLLVQAGAAPALANDKNYVPLDLASFGEKFDVVDYFLKEAGMLEDGNVEGGLDGAAANVEIEDDQEEETVEESATASAQK